MNSYELSRAFIDYAFENPDKINPTHYAIYFFAIEHCNRLGWKRKFGLPSQMVMEAIGVKNWRTYIKCFNDLVEFGFIEVIEKSKNQYSSNIIAIVKNTKATTKALDKALQKHSTKQGKSIVSIDKQINKEQLNNITTEPTNFVLEIINNQQQIFEPLKMKHSKLKDLDLAIEQYSLSEMSNPKPREVATTIYFALDKWLNSWSTNNFGKKKDEPHPDWNGGNTKSGITL
jgi:hypothetical protein